MKSYDELKVQKNFPELPEDNLPREMLLEHKPIQANE